MKTFYIFLLCCISILVKSQEVPTTLLFIDKSPSATKHYGDELEHLVLSVLQQEIKGKKHNLLVSFIYEGTESSLNREIFRYRIDDQPDVAGLSDYKGRQKQLQYRQSILAYQRAYADRIIKFINEKHLAHTQTNIWGAMRVVQEVQAQCKTGISVVLISDMIPCSQHARYHCKRGKQLQSYQEAKQLAKKDCKRLTATLQLDSTILRRVTSVRIHLLGETLSTSTASVFLPTYWNTALNELGINEVLLE